MSEVVQLNFAQTNDNHLTWELECGKDVMPPLGHGHDADPAVDSAPPPPYPMNLSKQKGRRHGELGGSIKFCKNKL